MEQYPTVRIVHGRRNTPDKNKCLSVEIEIYFQRKRKWISTGVMVPKSNWRGDKKVAGRADALDLNLKIENVENTVMTFIRKLMIDNKPFTWSGLQTILSNGNSDNSFLKFVENRVISRQDIKESTRKNHKKLCKSLKEFGKLKSFSDLTKQNIILYDEWLHSRKSCSQTTIASYHKFLKVFINDAIRMELLSKNPYEGIKIDRGKAAQRKFLGADELMAIEISQMPTQSLEQVKDLFIFQCYTGLAYADMAKFDFGTVIRKDERYVIHDTRQKTGEDFYIVLLPKAFDVLKKYNFKLPLMSNQQYNLRLKLVAMYAGLTKNLTSHMGRHTYATMCLNSGIKIETLATMLGHSDIKTTQIYAKMVNETVENAYDVLRILDEVKSTIYQLTSIMSCLSVILTA